MAGIPPGSIPTASSVNSTDTILITQPGPSTKKATVANIVAAAGGGVSTLAALTDIDDTTEATGKVLSVTSSGGKPFSWISPTTGGVSSINGLTGAASITSPDSSVGINVVGSDIELTVAGGGGGGGTADATSYKSVILADTPYAYYRLKEASGTTMTDSSGNSRDGTFTGNPGFSAISLANDSDDSAVLFGMDGSTETYGVAPFTIDSWSAFTFECLCTPTGGLFGSTATNGRLFSNGVYGASGFELAVNSNLYDILFQWQATGGYGSLNGPPAAFKPGALNHVAVTFDATAGGVVYVNGVVVFTWAGGHGNVNPTSQNLHFGNEVSPTASAQFIGYMDEIAIYNTALSSTRIQAHLAALRTTAA
jgi:hypothetical protein